ncbi:tyrosine-type recombinase/integrase [Microbacterium binotii]|uniref:Tyr recombinase domain-containing protein n=1 Tax=Microbacterium binotii TaxID=462710 RepID=A0ABN3P7L9_9MICO
MRLLDYDRQFDVASLIRYYFKPALAELGLAGVRWHDLRRYYASVCAAAGIEIRKVSRWMGHANINTTDSIYTHLFNGSHDEDMDRLDAAARSGASITPLRELG